jgi:hypothetical protein
VIGVTLLTCDRFEYTQRTLDSLAAHNNLSKFALFHADDASEDDRIVPLVQSYGFQTIVRNKVRSGWLQTRTKLIKLAIRRNSRWILNLENDIESVRPFPWDLFKFVQKRTDICSLRLYGRYKDSRKRDACLTFHKQTREQANWRPLKWAPEQSQIGKIHWSAQPSVTRAAALWDLHRYQMDLSGYTVRVKKNVMVHIGTERTIPREPACLAS